MSNGQFIGGGTMVVGLFFSFIITLIFYVQ